MAGAAPAPPQQQHAARAATTTAASSDVSAMLQQVVALLFPSNLAAKAALFALVVALVPLLPTSQAPRIWELPHLLLLGIIISYGVFGQKNADAEAAAADDAKPADEEASVEAYVSQMMQGSPLVFEDDNDGDDGGRGGGRKSGVQAWSSQYLPDDPLVVVADANNGGGDAGEKPLHLPVRKLKPAAEDLETPALVDDVISDGIEEEEEEEEGFLGPKAGGYKYDGVRERATIPSPSSVLDADLTLSPPSSPPLLPPPPPPPPPPFLGRGGSRSLRKKAAKARSFNGFGAIANTSANERLGLHGVDGRQFRSKSAVQATRSAFAGYDPAVPVDDDDYDAVDAELDEGVAASENSFSSDMVTDGDDGKSEDIFEDDDEEEEDGSSCDEELFELATKPGPEVDEEEVEEEVDRKADEFIAKFREQIRMQRVEPATRR